MRDCMRLIPWIIAVVAVITTISSIFQKDYHSAIWCWVAFVGWLNAACANYKR